MKTNTLLIGALASTLAACGGAESAHQPGSGALSLSGNGGGNSNSTGKSNSTEQTDAGGANIKYLRDNHDSYSHYGDTSSYPVELYINGDQVYWDIEADTEKDAQILAGHIEFMSNALDNSHIPRRWDKLFVLEAFLHDQIHTDVKQDDTRVTINKTGDTECAYELIKVHASAVSNEFFATGDISADHSSSADQILALDICADQREEAEAFIAEHWAPR